VLGGEYSGSPRTKTETNTGEIYDPTTNSWSAIAPVPESEFGDGPSEALGNGLVLAGSLTHPQTYLYNPSNNTWSQTGNKQDSDASSEETWVKLPDGSILSHDIKGVSPQPAQRFDPLLNEWVSSGYVPVQLASNAGDSAAVPEIGPAFLLPDGRVFFLGASGNTALYTPPIARTGSGSWVAGPQIPDGLGAFDAPGAMLPNGKVLFAAGAIDISFPPPTSLFEYDPSTNTIGAVNAPSTFFAVRPNATRMLKTPELGSLFKP